MSRKTFGSVRSRGPLVADDSLIVKGVALDVPGLASLSAALVWVGVDFVNGYSDEGAPYAGLEYATLRSGVVWLRGAVAGAAGGSVICTLPVGFRPSMRRAYVWATLSAGLCIGEVREGGEVYAFWSGGASAVFIEAIYDV
jgi:hypothetical protein